MVLTLRYALVMSQLLLTFIVSVSNFIFLLLNLGVQLPIFETYADGANSKLVSTEIYIAEFSSHVCRPFLLLISLLKCRI